MDNEAFITTSTDFAIYLSKVAASLEKEMNLTKVQKWLYICYGLFLELYGRRLFDEQPIAGDYGPFFPKVYELQKQTEGALEILSFNPAIAGVEAYNTVIYTTLEHFGETTATKLVDWTHKDGTAWQKKYSHAKYNTLDDNDIKVDFAPLIRK